MGVLASIHKNRKVYLQGVHPLKLFARRFFSLINPTHNFKLELWKWGQAMAASKDGFAVLFEGLFDCD
jgi:hypothetical protein